jgi:hypothetical protein
MVIVFADQVADNPEGRPVAVPIPVTPVVVWVILVKGELMQRVELDDAILAPLTVIVPVAVAPPHPPVKGMV